jgi:beta-glucosidase
MAMPGDISFDSGTTYFGSNLTAYVNNGTISQARVDDMGISSPFHLSIDLSNYPPVIATRILAAWYFLHQDSPTYPSTNFNAFSPDDDATNERIDVQADHHTLVRELGAASAVLLKNERGALPLGKKDRTISLIGSGAGPGTAGPNEFADRVRLYLRV